MIGSDNVCYVLENKGLNGFDSDINSPKLQGDVCGRNSEPSAKEPICRRLCAACALPLTARQERCCSARCQRVFALSSGRKRDQRGPLNGNWKGGRAKHPVVYVRRFKAANPEKARAHQIVAAAIRTGILTRPSCCASCLRDGRVDAHHPDYTRPLSVEWLCRKCHIAADRLQRPRKPRSANPKESDRHANIVRLPWKFRGTHRRQSEPFSLAGER